MISKQDGDWWVTTPLYIGDDAAIFRMTLCGHGKYDVSHPAQVKTIPETGDRVELTLEKCVACGAVRSRYRYPDTERNRLP